ncbi:hypothetical protein OH77DRAFT_1586868 [Trametes cingulata]|nr:hypothetical protein OH77DRAFT_1586868 [Trametes cingulata]
MESGPPPADQDEGLAWRMLDESVKEFEKKAHPLTAEEYTAAVEQFLIAIAEMETMDDLDDPFETLYAVCHRYAGQDIATKFLADYSVQSRELGVRVARDRVTEVEKTIEELKKKRDELIGAESKEIISSEESREQRKALNSEINSKIRDLRMLRGLLANCEDALNYARKYGRYEAHRPLAKQDTAVNAPVQAEASSRAEPALGDSKATSTSDSPPKKRVRILSVERPSVAESSAPEAQSDEGEKILVTWPQPCDRCKKLGKQCTRGQERILRCTECGSPRLLQCLYNGINAYGEVKEGKKTLAQFNGIGFSFPTRLSATERTIAERRVRDIVKDWRAPLWVNEAGLVDKLKHFNPAHAAITDFRHPPENEVDPRASVAKAAEAAVTRQRAARDRDTVDASPVDSISTTPGLIASSSRAEAVAEPPEGSRPNPSPQASLLDHPIPAVPLSRSSFTRALSQPITSVASHAITFSPTPRDQIVAQIRARYNALYAERVVIGRQLAGLRREEEEQTGRPFGTYNAVGRGFALERPLDDDDFSADK